MKAIQQMTQKSTLRAILGTLCLLVLTIVPTNLVAGDLDSVGGYKYKIYEETPPGDGPSGSALQSGPNSAGNSSTNSTNTLSVSRVEHGAKRVVISEFWVWLRHLAQRR